MEKRDFIGKQELRNRYLGYRNSLSAEERKKKSEKICELLKHQDVFQSARTVLVYMDYRSEVMTTGLVKELLDAGEKRIFAPKVCGMDIRFYEIRSMGDLAAGYQGIREPKEDAEKLFSQQTVKETNCLVLTPGAVFDRERGRMGYGKGFYDRFLAAYPDIYSVALAFDCQMAKKVPVEAHDKRPDMIITETGVIGYGE